MKKLAFSLFLTCCTLFLFAQSNNEDFAYAISDKHPYGMMHPDAPKELADYASLIGECQCKSIARIDQQTWADTVDMTWTWKYILNGMGVQDETLKTDGKHSGSIRQFIADSARWYVHYYSSNGPTTALSTWEGNKTDEGNIVLYRDSPAPNGTPGDYRLTFYDISDDGYSWVGEWVNKDETIAYPTWRIICRREK